MKSFQYYKNKYTKYIIPSIVMIYICQLIPLYIFSGLEARINLLYKTSIYNQKIIEINYLKFKSSKYKTDIYPEVVLKNKEKHPIILDHRKDEKNLEIGSFINKKKNSNYITLNGHSKKYFLRDFTNAKILLKIFMFFVSLGGIYSMITTTENEQ